MLSVTAQDQSPAIGGGKLNIEHLDGGKLVQHGTRSQPARQRLETRPLPLTDETGYISRVSVQENREGSRLFKRLSRQVRRITRKPFAYRFHRPEDLTQIIFPCAGVQKIWESHVEPGFRNNCTIRLASEFRLLGLTEEEAGMKLFEWNEKNSIDLPSHELQNVVRSAYQHRFPYRYSCRDEILQRFCPLPDYEACEARILSHSERQ